MSSRRSASLPAWLAVAVLAAAVGYFAGRYRPATTAMAPLAAATTTATTAPTAAGGERRIRFYQSPMHPWITSSQPGRCTICGMALVPVYEGDAGFGDGTEVKLSDATAAVVGVETDVVQETNFTRTLRVNGTFEADHTRHRILSARVPGRIETLHVDQIGVTVAAGDPLATLYSPEMLTAQRVYLERLAVGPSAISSSEISAARERLLDLGADETEIDRLESSRRPAALVAIRAPFAGTVISRGANAYPGAYVAESDNLFELADLTSLWFEFDVYESDLAQLRVGQSVTVTPAGSTAPIEGEIAFIDPNLDPMTRVAHARVVLDNSNGALRHRQTATAEIHVSLGRALTIPRSAVLFTRERPTVFVALPDRAYAPRAVALGRANADTFEVTAGLAAGDRVVTRAALLLEGQAQLATPALPATETAATDAAGNAADIAALEPLILAAADAAAALAADDLAAYQRILPRIHESWTTYLRATPHADAGPLAERVAALAPGTSLKDARQPFEPFSTQVADLARAAGLGHSGRVHIFQCPMSPVLGTGRWVQRDAELRNPFYGEAMPTCGDPVE